MSLEDITSQYETKDFSDYAPAMVMLNDTHADLDIIQKSIDELQKYEGKKIISLSDYFDHHNRKEVFARYGIKDEQALYLGLVRDKLSDDEQKNVFDYVTTIQSMGGIKNYLNRALQSGQISQEHAQDFIKEQMYSYSQAEKKFKELNLEEKANLSEKELKELDQLVEKNKVMGLALDQAMNIYEAQGLAKIINESKDITWVMNSGNHDPVNAWEEVYKLLDDKNKLIDANKIKGVMRLGKEELNVAFAGNCYGIMNPTDSLVYGEDLIQELYPQMRPYGVAQDITKEQADSLSEENIKQSLNWHRISDSGKDKTKIDVLALHSELGTPLGFEENKVYPNIDDVGILYLSKNQMSENGFIAAGHIHSDAEGENEFGTKTVRGPATLVTKENGNLEFKRIQKEHHDGSSYDLDKINSILENIIFSAEKKVE